VSDFLTDSTLLLESICRFMDGSEVLSEARKSKLTPYQKAQQKRRRTVAAHSPRPAKQSVFYKHAVRAIYNNLRKRGEGFKGAVKGGQLIAQWMLKKYGYATGQPTGNFRLTGKGLKRNVKHVREPSSVRRRKERAYDYLMGIQRRKKKEKEQVRLKSIGAG